MPGLFFLIFVQSIFLWCRTELSWFRHGWQWNGTFYKSPVLKLQLILLLFYTSLCFRYLKQRLGLWDYKLRQILISLSAATIWNRNWCNRKNTMGACVWERLQLGKGGRNYRQEYFKMTAVRLIFFFFKSLKNFCIFLLILLS